MTAVYRAAWKEAALARLLRYVAVDTTAVADRPSPSSPGQLELGRQLMDELRQLGLRDVAQDAYGIVTATLPASPGREAAPVVGLLAHLDTSPEAPGGGIKPRVIRRYDGGVVTFSGVPGLTLDPTGVPELGECRGHDLLFSDGTTLLGADDKAGVAAIVTALEHLTEHPEIPHGCVRVAFTSDEEIGQGIKHLDVATFGADAAYTLDGGPAGEIGAETFSADLAIVRIKGRNAHPGDAKDRMVSALKVAADLVASLPADEAPETTDQRQGFLHPYQLHGGVGDVEIRVLLRDFDTSMLGRRQELLRDKLQVALERRPGATGDVEIVRQYRNMADWLRDRPEVAERLETAVRRAGLTPRREPVRGGTDGSQLTERGLPCPNLFCGEHNAHAVTEWACLDDVAASVAVLVELVQEWAGA